MKTVAELIKEALSCLLTVQEVVAKPLPLSEDDRIDITVACDNAVWKLLAADGIQAKLSGEGTVGRQLVLS